MKAALIALALCTTSPTSECARPEARVTEEDLSSLSNQELIALVQDKKNRVDRDVFRELGSRGTQDAFDALVTCTKMVSSIWALRYSHEAFAGFKSEEELAEQCIDFLGDTACGSEPMRSSAAAYSLSLFGDLALPGLRRALKTSKNPTTRATALAPLLPTMAAGGERAAFKTAYENLVLTYRVHRPLGVEAFKTFAETGGVGLFEKRLSDKKISAEVRGMMVTALEQTPGDEALEVLAEGLKAKEPRLLYESIRALSRRGATLHRGSLQKLTRHKDDAVRHEALISITRLSLDDPKILQSTIKLARDRDPINRGAAAISLGELRTAEAMDALHGLLGDEAFTVRVEALIGVSIARKASSVPLVAARLESATGAERERVHKELRLLTGLDHGKSAKRWADWWREEGEAFNVPDLEDALAAEQARRERREANSTQSSFYGLNILSDRVCFVLDLSGSMNFRSRSGGTRLSILKKEMDRFLKGYATGHLFNMIFFGNGAQRWRPSLTTMDDKVRRAAQAHVKSLDAPGATAVYDGLYAAFEDPLIDTIYLLTDGGPSGGEMDDINEIIMEVNRWNSLRHVVIHTIAVGRKSPLLETLSADTGGEHLVVD